MEGSGAAMDRGNPAKTRMHQVIPTRRKRRPDLGEHNENQGKSRRCLQDVFFFRSLYYVNYLNSFLNNPCSRFSCVFYLALLT